MTANQPNPAQQASDARLSASEFDWWWNRTKHMSPEAADMVRELLRTMSRELTAAQVETPIQRVLRVARSLPEWDGKTFHPELVEAMAAFRESSQPIEPQGAVLGGLRVVALELRHHADHGPVQALRNIMHELADKLDALPVAVGAGEVELTDDLRKILGMMCFQLARYAHLMRKVGFKVEPKAEDEQAVTLHWLLNHYFAHGKDWHIHADADVKRWLAEAEAMTPATPAGKGQS